jgi:hypothetical protein
LKERDCSLRLTSGEQSGSERNALKPAFRAVGRRSKKQCSDTNIRGAKLRGATRSAGSGRMNTAEINDAWCNNFDARPLTEADLPDDYSRSDNEPFLGANPYVMP